ncbi:conserved Plasmodium protein, unknown function [Plasmodium ovale]|uniref:LisH domain-containing protein n=1 Tax=Plasmodium ovale TaxID=36330 RepID=A0A1C3L5A4_PLAOA|nr:conserved Plasmodium protein, unknown function [Plasmodium ovale]
MKKEFEEYNKKYFRNLQFIYDFLEKVGMKNSLNELRNESKINYVREYDKYFLENYIDCHPYEGISSDSADTVVNGNVNVDSDGNSGESGYRDSSDNCQGDDLSDDEDIDKTLFMHTIDRMNNCILCKAIDTFESVLKKNKNEEKDYTSQKGEETSSECATWHVNKDLPASHQKERINNLRDDKMLNKKKKKFYIKEGDTYKVGMNIDRTSKLKNSLVLGNMGESLKSVPFLGINSINLPVPQNGKVPMDVGEKLLREAVLSRYRSINSFPFPFENKNGIDLCGGREGEDGCHKGGSEKDDCCRGGSEKEDGLRGGREKDDCRRGGSEKESCCEGKSEQLPKRETHNWDNYFTYERETCRELKVKYIGSPDGKNKIKNGSYNYAGMSSNILAVKYIDIYNMETCKNMRFENIIFFKKVFPILLLVGYTDGNVKLFLILYEKGGNENNMEECIHICKELDYVSLNSPVMYIDINYKDSMFISSTMNGDIYICQINMNSISLLTKYIDTNNSVDDIKNNVKGDEKYISIMKKLTYHKKYSLKCVFNDDYTLFCSIGNDKNLIVYEKAVGENETPATYEKKKVIGFPEIPTSVLWIRESGGNSGCDSKCSNDGNGFNTSSGGNGRESIVTSMLNSNHVLLINSKTYSIEEKIHLFGETEKYNILSLEYNRYTSVIFVYSLISKSIIRKIYGCVLNSLSFPTMEIDINGNNIYITSDDNANGTHILIFDIKSGNIIDVINNGYKIRCFQLLKSYICPFSNETNSNNIEVNKKSLLILGSFDKRIHFYSN